jgi:phospholipid/cholesterol/gamma-HCH transport system substrate-binding protein
MTETSSSEIRVGLVIAAAIAIAAAAIFSIGKETRFLTGAQVIEAHFHLINGLQAGAPVTLSGVNIGAVESIHFPPDPTADYVIVKMWIEGSAEPRVRADSKAQIRSAGLLGDKFIELTRGSPSAPPAEPGAVVASTDPIDYESVLQSTTNEDFFANVVSATSEMRTILGQLENGHGVLSQMLRDDGRQRLDLRTAAETLDHVNRLSVQLSETLDRLNHGRSIAATMLSERTDGRKLLSDLSSSMVSLRTSAQRLDQLTARLQQAQGTLPQLLENRRYAAEILPELKQSTRDLQEILQKINSGQGSLGQMVNDPTLYNEAKGMLDGGGWGLSLLHGLYSVSHPFRSPQTSAEAAQPALPNPDLQPAILTGGAASTPSGAGPAAAPTGGVGAP